MPRKPDEAPRHVRTRRRLGCSYRRVCCRRAGDLAFAVNSTPERALVIDFGTPVLVHSFTLITPKGFAESAT